MWIFWSFYRWIKELVDLLWRCCEWQLVDVILDHVVAILALMDLARLVGRGAMCTAALLCVLWEHFDFTPFLHFWPIQEGHIRVRACQRLYGLIDNFHIVMHLVRLVIYDRCCWRIFILRLSDHLLQVQFTLGLPMTNMFLAVGIPVDQSHIVLSQLGHGTRIWEGTFHPELEKFTGIQQL